MGILVSAAQAARLVDRHERIVRWHRERGDFPNARKGPRGAWLIDTDDLASIAGWTIDREELAKLELRQRRGHSGLVARVEALEARMRSLEARLAAQSVATFASAATSPHRDSLPALPAIDVLPHPHPLDSRLSASQGHSGAFSHKTSAARWLARHGVNEHTPKSWRGWPPDELTPTAVLDFALETQRAARARGDWRVAWRLARCDDPLCACRDAIEG